MKPKLKYTLIAIATIIFFCGFKYSNREGNEIPGNQQMEILHFHGHTYVCYRFYEREDWNKGYCYGYGGASIVHDPDCKCGKGGGR